MTGEERSEQQMADELAAMLEARVALVEVIAGTRNALENEGFSREQANEMATAIFLNSVRPEGQSG